MKIVFCILFGIGISVAQAQIILDQTRTNCTGQTESLYESLDANKVVLVSADGFDCSICISHSPSIGNFATNNPNIKVWGALGYKYSTQTPTCLQVNNWVNSYSWNEIFSFVDANRSWAGNGYPTYTVIDPQTKTVAYRGVSNIQAMNKANEVAQAIVTSTNPFLNSKSGLSANCCRRVVSLYGFENPVAGTIYIQDLQGRRIETRQLVILSNGFEIQLDKTLARGNYIVIVQLANKTMSARVLVTDYE